MVMPNESENMKKFILVTCDFKVYKEHKLLNFSVDPSQLILGGSFLNFLSQKQIPKPKHRIECSEGTMVGSWQITAVSFLRHFQHGVIPPRRGAAGRLSMCAGHTEPRSGQQSLQAFRMMGTYGSHCDWAGNSGLVLNCGFVPCLISCR